MKHATRSFLLAIGFLLGMAPAVPAQDAGSVLWLKADAIKGLNNGDTVPLWSDSSGLGNDAVSNAASGGDPVAGEAILNNDPVLWLKADAIQGLNDGDPVVNWADSSGTGNDAATTLGSPTYHTDVLNSLPAIRFDNNVHGAHDELQVPEDASLDLTNYTIFVVAIQDSTDWDTLLVKGGLPTTTAWNYLIAPDAGSNRIQAGANAQAKPSVGHPDRGNADSVTQAGQGISGSWGIFAHRADLTIAHLGDASATVGNFLNGTNVFAGGSSFGTENTDFTNDEPVFIGGGGSPDPVEGGAPFTGDIAEIAILPYTASNQQILDVSAHLGEKYGIAGPDSGSGPTYHTNVLNGLPVVRFDVNFHGPHDEFQVPDDPSLDLTNYSIFVVALQDSTEWDTLLVKGGLPTSTAWNYLIAPNGPSAYQAGANAQGKTPNGNADSVSNAGIGGSFGIIGHRADLTIAHLGVVTDTIGNFLNGNDVFKGGSSFGDPATDFTNDEPVFIGGGGSPLPVEGGEPFTGDIAEIAILPFTATDQQVLDVTAYLGEKYGIEVEAGGDAVAGLTLLGGVRPQILTDVFRDPGSGDLTLTWNSRDGRLYNVRSELDLSTDPATWPIFDGHQDLAATPPENTLSFSFPADDSRYFVVEEFPAPPVSLVSDDFESGEGDWTTGSDGLGGTAWELGAPSNVGPNSANSPTNCFGTNLAAEYDFDADVWLRSPPIDLTNAAGATLNYFQYFEIEVDFDLGKVSVVDAGNNSELAVLVPVVDGSSAGWEEVSMPLPATALGKTVKIEFRLDSDDVENRAGWYIDDFDLTVP